MKPINFILQMSPREHSKIVGAVLYRLGCHLCCCNGGAVMDLRTGKWKMASTPLFRWGGEHPFLTAHPFGASSPQLWTRVDATAYSTMVWVRRGANVQNVKCIQWWTEVQTYSIQSSPDFWQTATRDVCQSLELSPRAGKSRLFGKNYLKKKYFIVQRRPDTKLRSQHNIL